jgi:hypothetical protein
MNFSGLMALAPAFARLLYEKMSAISEDFWCAGWLSATSTPYGKFSTVTGTITASVQWPMRI